MKRRASAGLIAVLLSGCATPRQSPTVLAPLPAGLTGFTAGPFGTPPGEWWRTRLSDPALARLIDAALANAPDLAAAAARIESARATVRARSADRTINVGASSGLTASRAADAEGIGSGNLPPGISVDRDRVTGRVGVDASYDVDLFGRLAADRRAALSRLDAATADAAAVRLALVTDVARNYVAAIAADARTRVARENIAAARQLVSITDVRVRAGLVAGIDATRGASLLAETAAALPPLQGERGVRVAALTTLTTLSPVEIGAIVAAAPAQLPRFGVPAVGVPSDIVARRPDIAAAIGRVAAADADTAAALAARYPSLTITGAIGLVATGIGGFFSGNALSLAGGPGLAGPLFDGGRNRALVEGARARTAEAVAAYRGTVLDAFGEVETNLALADARARQRTALEAQVAADADTASIARIQYRRGLTDFLGVLIAQQALFRSRDAAIAAAAAAADAELSLFRAIGGDLPPVAVN